jgi:hypothetical protein
MQVLPDRIVFYDTEDNSLELAQRGESLFKKRLTQIAALTSRGESFYNKGDATAFLNWLSSLIDPIRVYAHNQQYDFGGLFGDSLDDLDITMVGGRLIRARFDNCTFLDSFNLWPMSLKKIGDAVGLKKLDLNVRSKRYVFRDVEILRKAINLASEFALELGVDPVPATLGGLCVQIWQAMGGRNWHCGSDWFRQGLYGGRVELFSNGGPGNIYYTDINSLYPYCMTLLFPGPVARQAGIGSHDYGMARVKIKIPKQRICPLPVRREDGSIYYPWGIIDGALPAGQYEGKPFYNSVWTFHEIRDSVKHGAELLEVYEAYGTTQAEPYYYDFVTKIYGRRKHEADPGRSLFLKLLMNNLYGQLSMSGKVTRSLDLNAHILRDKTGAPAVDECGNQMLDRDGSVYGRKLLANIQMPLPVHENILHGAYITSYARLRLLRFLRCMPADRLIYCDTDSLFFYQPPGSEPPFGLGKELGEMKLEGRPKAVFTYGPKFYSVKGENGKTIYKVKGVPNRITELDKLRLSQKKIKSAKTLAQVFTEKGEVEFLQPFKLRESIAFYDDWKAHGVKGHARRLGVWHLVTKRKISEYDKKRFLKGYWFPIKHSPQ